MPRVDDNIPTQAVPQPQIMYLGEAPKTEFVHPRDALKVECIYAPDRTALAQMLNEVLEATHAPRPPEPQGKKMKGTTIDALAGSGLWQAAELMSFTFRISGVSRIFTHQLVRARIGVTFFQQCTGDHDTRHARILVPGAISGNNRAFRQYVYTCLQAKQVYADMLDSGIPVQEARYVQPHGIETFIYMHATLATLAGLYQKRSCTMTNAWEMVRFAEALKSAITFKYRELEPMFQSACDKGKCWFHSAKYSGKNTPWWTPDEKHDNFDWHASDWVHGRHAQTSDPEHSVFDAFSFEGHTLTTGKLPWENDPDLFGKE